MYGNNPESRDSENDEKLVVALAHEINNPLQSLMDLLYLLRAESTLTEQAHRYLTLACEEGQRISLLARDAMNRLPETAATRLTSNVPDVLSGVLDFYRSRFESQGISIGSRYCKDGESANRGGTAATDVYQLVAQCCGRDARAEVAFRLGLRLRASGVDCCGMACALPSRTMARVSA